MKEYEIFFSHRVAFSEKILSKGGISVRSEYEPAELYIVEFDCEDVITTSDPDDITDITNPNDKFLDHNETLPVNP